MARGLDGDGVRVNDMSFVEKFRYDDIRVLFVVQCPVLVSPRLICDDIICGRTRGPSQSYHLQLFDPESRIGCRPWNEAIICLFFHCMLETMTSTIRVSRMTSGKMVAMMPLKYAGISWV